MGEYHGGRCWITTLKGEPVLKKLLILAGIVAGAAYVAKRAKATKDERALWHEATTSPELR